MRTNHVPKDVSDSDPKRDWDRDLNYVRSHALQTPSQSRSRSAHCEIIFCSCADWPMRYCMASACIFKMHTHDWRSERALHSHVLESGISKAWFETALHSQGLKSCFQISKGLNHVLKELSEHDSFSCKQAQWSISKQLGSTKTKQASHIYMHHYITHLHLHTWSILHNSYMYMSKMCTQNVTNTFMGF